MVLELKPFERLFIICSLGVGCDIGILLLIKHLLVAITPKTLGDCNQMKRFTQREIIWNYFVKYMWYKKTHYRFKYGLTSWKEKRIQKSLITSIIIFSLDKFSLLCFTIILQPTQSLHMQPPFILCLSIFW